MQDGDNFKSDSLFTEYFATGKDLNVMIFCEACIVRDKLDQIGFVSFSAHKMKDKFS